MKTNEFIATLRANPDNRLIFVDGEGRPVHSGYHLTELKAATFDTVDCGGEQNRWEETIVQLWVPADPDDDYMTAAKFLKIFDKVRGMIEYGDEHFFPSTYHVRSITQDQESTRVLLEPPVTTCKARDRRGAGMRTETACCT